MAAVAKLLIGMLCGTGAVAAIVVGVMASASGREMVSNAIFLGTHVAVIGPFALTAGALVVANVLLVIAFFVGALAFALVDKRLPGRPTALEGIGVPIAAVIAGSALWYHLHGRIQASWGVDVVVGLWLSIVAGAAIVGLAYAVAQRIQPVKHVPIAAVAFVALVAALSTLQPTPEAARADAEFERMCKGAYAVFCAEPGRPVASIAHDWNPAWRDRPPTWQSYSFDEHGRWTSFREGRWGQPTYRENPGADVIVLHEVFGYNKELPAPKRGLLRYAVTVKDQRDSQVLAVLTYVLDASGRRGCGMNRGNAIDIEDFVRRATTPGGGDKPIYWKPT